VQTVLARYYLPFLERFPTVQALAAAEAQEVLKLWQGLGYYNRARNLHAAAKTLSEQGFPTTVSALQQLAGIGRNTAHAIAAFAFHQPVPVLEANVKRVVARIFALESPKPAQLWHAAELLLDNKHPFDYNQAMMDVGAMICTPVAPRCEICPAAMICQGRESPQSYPAAKPRKTLPERQIHVILFTDTTGRIFMQPRCGRFLHGLWQFAEYDATENPTAVCFHETPYSLAAMEKLGEVSHAYSHFRLMATVYRQRLPFALPLSQSQSPAEIAALPLSRTEVKIGDLLRKSPNFKV
jgi:A/G-specific adenine glycosylase